MMTAPIKNLAGDKKSQVSGEFNEKLGPFPSNIAV